VSEIEVRLQKQTSCLAGWVSWPRLEAQLKLSGELKQGESITNLVANEYGIKYYVIKGKIELQKEKESNER